VVAVRGQFAIAVDTPPHRTGTQIRPGALQIADTRLRDRCRSMSRWASKRSEKSSVASSRRRRPVSRRKGWMCSAKSPWTATRSHATPDQGRERHLGIVEWSARLCASSDHPPERRGPCGKNQRLLVSLGSLGYRRHIRAGSVLRVLGSGAWRPRSHARRGPPEVEARVGSVQMPAKASPQPTWVRPLSLRHSGRCRCPRPR